MYSLADRYQLLSPSSFAATQMLGNLGQGIVPSLLSREVGPVRASLNFLLHALAPLTATEDVKKVQVLRLRLAVIDPSLLQCNPCLHLTVSMCQPYSSAPCPGTPHSD